MTLYKNDEVYIQNNSYIYELLKNTYKESKLEYKYYTTSSPEFIYREDWVEHNYNIFLKYHTLEFIAQ